jgi:diphthamide synthase (EF-2-diphthine--ammonia ligase)
MRIAPRCSNDEYERALSQALVEMRVRYPGVRRIVFGDLFLEDVRRYREERLAALGFTALFPLWGSPTHALGHDLIERGYTARLVCVDTQALDAQFAGRAYDERLLEQLPATVDPYGERGEFHTFVSDGPGFSDAVAYEVGDVVLRDERFAYCDLLPA